MTIFVPGLSFQVTNDQLERSFASYGVVSFSNVVIVRETGRSRDFGFVEMPYAAAVTEAMKQLNGKIIEGKLLTVNEARPKDNSIKKIISDNIA